MENSQTDLEIAAHSVHALFCGEEHLLQFFFHHKRVAPRATPKELLAEAKGLSPADCLLVRVALDIWSGEGGVTLANLLALADDKAVLRVLTALTYHRQMIEAWEALSCCE